MIASSTTTERVSTEEQRSTNELPPVLNGLPIELWKKIFAEIAPFERMKIGAVCRAWHSLNQIDWRLAARDCLSSEENACQTINGVALGLICAWQGPSDELLIQQLMERSLMTAATVPLKSKIRRSDFLIFSITGIFTHFSTSTVLPRLSYAGNDFIGRINLIHNAAQRGNSLAQFLLALGEYSISEENMHKLSEQGCPYAQILLAENEEDLKSFVERGFPCAKMRLLKLLNNGDSIITLKEDLAEAGSTYYQIGLAIRSSSVMRSGEDSKLSRKKSHSLKLWEDAAKAGNPLAQYSLGMFAYDGESSEEIERLKKQDEEALFFYIGLKKYTINDDEGIKQIISFERILINLFYDEAEFPVEELPYEEGVSSIKELYQLLMQMHESGKVLPKDLEKAAACKRALANLNVDNPAEFFGWKRKRSYCILQ